MPGPAYVCGSIARPREHFAEQCIHEIQSNSAVEKRATRNHPSRNVPEFVSIRLAKLLEAFLESELLPSGNTKAQKTN